jgi:hypothetical protein
MKIPIKQFIQHLIIDTVNTTRCLDTAVHIALSHKNISQIRNSDTTNILHKTFAYNKTIL